MKSSRDGCGRLTLPPQRRLRRKSEFEAVYTGGRRVADRFFSVTVRANDCGAARLGLAVAVRAAGSAVERNRIRRIVRESFRLRQREMPAVDLVVSARPAVRGVTNAQLRVSIVALWERVIQQCAASPRS